MNMLNLIVGIVIGRHTSGDWEFDKEKFEELMDSLISPLPIFVLAFVMISTYIAACLSAGRLI